MLGPLPSSNATFNRLAAFIDAIAVRIWLPEWYKPLCLLGVPQKEVERGCLGKEREARFENRGMIVWGVDIMHCSGKRTLNHHDAQYPTSPTVFSLFASKCG
jgi:hypothetical protein